MRTSVTLLPVLFLLWPCHVSFSVRGFSKFTNE
uniref:Uncharacterized protein n=1 Tax=Anguilla anguilla TaxID=7936 RepID=A0A0E9TSJ0_ANGAN